jgi:hypothetical protein
MSKMLFYSRIRIKHDRFHRFYFLIPKLRPILIRSFQHLRKIPFRKVYPLQEVGLKPNQYFGHFT